MKSHFLIALTFSLFSLSAFAKSYSITITFDKSSKEKLSALHQNYNTKVNHTHGSLPKQVVVSKVHGLNYNEDYLKTLCEMYLQNRIIEKCVTNTKSRKSGSNF
ncbi:MAG: hypothetical protein KAG61_11240 [Bacteriovoracaceae bacterium]|nr:hypothetical protein [Bacteriovoracaceae bacterium]